jgi:hypothetical protein
VNCGRALALVPVLLCAGAGSRAEDYVVYTGTATALRTHDVLYHERHVMAARDGRVTDRVVLYTCRGGSPFARKVVSYVEPFAPNFVLEDASNGMREGVRTEAGGRVVFFRAGKTDAEKHRALPQVPGLVIDAGFDDFVRANWPALTADKNVYLHFLVPSRLDDMGFLIEELHADRVDGTPVQVFRLKLSGILGWFLPGIDVYYGVKDRLLMRYVGLSDLRDAAGDNMKVEIRFDPQDRKPALKDDYDQALQARLAPCP